MPRRDLVAGKRRWTPEQVEAFADHMGVTYRQARLYMRELATAEKPWSARVQTISYIVQRSQEEAKRERDMALLNERKAQPPS